MCNAGIALRSFNSLLLLLLLLRLPTVVRCAVATRTKVVEAKSNLFELHKQTTSQQQHPRPDIRQHRTNGR